MQLPLPVIADTRLALIRGRLISAYGPQRDYLRHDPTTQFFKAIISSCTRDAISGAAFGKLREYLPSWDKLPDADAVKIAIVIKDVTYAAEKAVHLVAAARAIEARRGGVDLAFLAAWPVDDAFTWLDHLPGAGPKVSAATLNFSTLRKRILVVDRHVLRVAKRLSLLPESADFGRGFRILMRLAPDDWDADDLYEMHWLMKLHGQTRCRHQAPLCQVCPFAKHCAHATG